MEPVHAVHVVAEAINLIRLLGNQRSIPVDFRDGAICDCYVPSDRQRFIQVLLNLLSNAVRYNREGGTVADRCHLDNGCLSLKVSDTGPGTRRCQLKQLFVSFGRLGGEYSTENGTGLDLVLSRHLAATIGGTLEVASRHGQGSQFTVTLPVVDAPTTRPATSLALSIEPSSHGTRRTVLYIEDNVSNLNLVEQILSLRPDVEIHAAMQGRLGVDLARQHRPDLVVFDLTFPTSPDVTSFESPRSIRGPAESPLSSSLPTPARVQIERLISAGAAGYLTKPLDVPAFLSELDHHFGS